MSYDETLMTMDEICTLMGRGRQTMWNYVHRSRKHHDGTKLMRNPFPREVSYHGERVWLRSEVLAWKAKQPERFHAPPVALNPLDAHQRYPYANRPLAALLGVPEWVLLTKGFKSESNYSNSTVTVTVFGEYYMPNQHMADLIHRGLKLPAGTMVTMDTPTVSMRMQFQLSGRIDKDTFTDVLRESRK